MRTTLAIDDDVLALARHEARSRGESVGAVISGLVRKGLARPPSGERSRAGVLLLPERPDGGPVTVEDVIRLREETE